MPRTAEVIYVGDPAPLIRATQEAAAAAQNGAAKIAGANAQIGESYGTMVAKADAAGKAAQAQAKSLGASLSAQDAAYARAAQAAGLANDKIALSAKAAGEAAAKQAQAVGASLEVQRTAYARAATAAKEKATAEEATAGKAAAANDAAAARIASAHAKTAAAAKKSSEAFGKWGTIAGAATIGVSAKLAIDLEKSSAAIAKAGGTSSEAGKRITESFKGLSGLEYSAAKVGEAFATIAGELKSVEGRALDTAKATEVMKAALDLTDATGGDLKSTTEALGKVMLTYGLHAKDAAKATDILFNTSKQTGTSVEQVAQTVDRMRGRLGALAPSLGETAGLMEELQKHGIAGRQSLQALTGVFGTLLGGSKKTSDTLRELGVHIFDSSGKFVGLRSVLSQLQPALSKYNEQSQLAATRALFGAGANRQLLSIIQQGPGAYDRATNAVSKQGAATAAAQKQHETLEGKLKITRAATENLSASLGQALIPALTKVAQSLSDGIQWLEKHKTVAKALAIVIGTVLGAAMIDFAVVKVAKFVGGIQTAMSAIKALAARFGLIPIAAEASAATTAAAEAGMATAVTTADGEIVAANAAAGASFTAMATTALAALAKIGAAVGVAVAAIAGFEKLLEKFTGESQHVRELLGGNQPGEKLREGEGTAQKWNQQYRQKTLDTGGGMIAYFMSKGLTRAQAAGIVGNAQQESGLDPKAAGGGLFQYIGSRAASGKGGAYEQLEATWKELNGAYRSVLERIKKAKTPEEAARIFSQGFERPGTPMLSNRERYAREAFQAHPHRQPSAATGVTGHSGLHEAHRKHAAAVEHATKAYGNQTLDLEGETKDHKKHHYEWLTASGKLIKAMETSAAHHHRILEEQKGRKEEQQGKRVATQEAAYVQPFAHATHLTRSRTDQGVDFSFAGPMGAVGKGVIEAVKQFQGFGTTIVEKLTKGPHAGQRIYYALETGADPRVHGGQQVRAGQEVAHGRGSGGVEIGFAKPGGLPVTRYAPGQSHDTPTAGGEAFSKFLASIGHQKGGGGGVGSNLELANTAFKEAEKRRTDLLASLQKAGSDALTKLSGVIQNNKLSEMVKYVDSAHEKALSALERMLTATHDKGLTNIATRLEAAHEKILVQIRGALLASIDQWHQFTVSLRVKGEQSFQSMADYVGKAAAKWAAAAADAIRHSPASQAAGAMHAADEAEDTKHTEEDLHKSLEAARKNLKEVKSTGDKEKTKEAEHEVLRAEEAITRFARDQALKREEDTVHAEEEGLTDRTQKYEAFLSDQLEKLTDQLDLAKISYQAWAQGVQAILAGAGLGNVPLPPGPAGGVVPHGFDPRIAGGMVAIGQGTGLPARASGGPTFQGVSYMVGEKGPELFTPSVSGHVTSAKQTAELVGAQRGDVNVRFDGPVTMGGRKQADQFAHRLAFRLKHG